jgi:hypothetical protein
VSRKQSWGAALLALGLAPALALASPAVQASGAPAPGEQSARSERTVTTGVTLRIRPAPAISGETVDLRVGLTPAARRHVVLQRRSQGRWVEVASGRTSVDGVRVFTRTAPGADRVFRVRVPRATVRGTTYAAAVSARRTLLTQRQSAVLRAPVRAVVGEPILFYAEAFPRRPGRPVALERRVAGGWATVEVRAQSGRGEVGWEVVLDAPGEVVHRATVLPHRGAPAVSSLSVRTTAEPPA